MLLLKLLANDFVLSHDGELSPRYRAHPEKLCNRVLLLSADSVPLVLLSCPLGC